MRFEEVEGWTAKKTTLTFCNGEVVESYQVTDCPLFRARDGSRWVQVSLDDVTRLLGIQRGTYTRAVVIEGRKSRELGGSAIAFAWFVWQKGVNTTPQIKWI